MNTKTYKSWVTVFLAAIIFASPFAANAFRGGVGVGGPGVGVGGPGVGVDRGYVGRAPGVGVAGAPVARAAANGRYLYNGRYYNYYHNGQYYNYYYNGAYYNTCQAVPGGMVCR